MMWRGSTIMTMVRTGMTTIKSNVTVGWGWRGGDGENFRSTEGENFRSTIESAVGRGGRGGDGETFRSRFDWNEADAKIGIS